MNFTSIKHSVSARVAAGAVGIAMALTFVTTANAQSVSDLAAQIAALQAQLAALQGGTATASSYNFTRNLTVGSTGADVKALQQFLNSNAATMVAASGNGSSGMETTYFGPATKAAVMKYQTANGISPVAGYFGPLTRAKVNATGGATTGGTTGGTTVPTGPGVSVVAGVQPANSLAPQNASRVPFTTFTLTNNTSSTVTISGVTVQRGGLAQDAVFSGVVLLDQNGLQVGIAHTFNSNHQTTIGDTFTLAAGQSMTYTVAGNMAASLSSYAGQVASLQVVAVNTTVPVSGVLPLTGASQTINSSLSIGTYSTSTSSYDPGSNQTKSIGDTNVRIAGVRFSASSAEDLKFYSVRWRQIGTAGASDFSNAMTYVNGTAYPTTVDASGKYYTTTFPGGILIPKGNTVDLYIQADMTGTNSSSRTIQFTIDKSTDVYFVGQLYGYGAVSSLYATSQPWFNTGYKVTLQAGTASVIQNASSVAATNIPVNVSNTVLGGFQTTFLGEPVSVTSLVLSVATSSAVGANGVLTNVSIVNKDGVVVAGPIDASVAATGETLTFTDTVTFPVGLQTYTVKGKVPAAWPNGGTVQLSVTPSSTTFVNATGQTTGNSVTISSGLVTMNLMTVKGAQLTITSSPSPVAQSITMGTGITLGNIQLDASQSGEDIRLNSLKLFEVGSDATPTELNSCQVWNGTTALNTGSNVVNTVTNDHATTPDGTTADITTFTFDNSLTVPKGTVMTLPVKCNVSASGGGSYAFGTYNGANGAPASIGVQSGNSLVLDTSLFVTTGKSGLQTVTTGSMTIAVDSSSPSYSLVAAGTSGVTVGVIKLRAANEDITLQKLGLTLTNSGNSLSSGSGASTNSGVNDLAQIYIYKGATLVGTAQFTGTSGAVATSSLTVPVTLTKDVDTLLTVKADLATIGVSGAGGIGDVVKVDPLNARGSGLSSGQTADAIATAGVAGIQMFKSYPTFAAGPTVPSNPNGTAQPLKKFSITANAAGPIGIYQIAVALATTSASVSNLKLFAYTDSGYSQPANVPGTTAGQFGGTAALTQALDTVAPVVSFYTYGYTSAGALQIPAGTTYYFAVKGDVAPASATATTWTVNVTVRGDSATTSSVGGTNATTTLQSRIGVDPTLGVSTSTVALSSGINFLWTDNATTTSATTTPDWFNGYYVPGLPSGGF